MRPFRLLPLLLACALAVSACVGQPPEEEADLPLPTGAPAVVPTPLAANADATAPAGEQAVITFGAQEYKRASYQTLIDQFNNENPDVHVEFLSLDQVVREGDTYIFSTDKIVRAADVAEIFGVNENDAKTGLVLDLKPFVDADSSFNRDDYFPIALAETGAGLYLIPAALNLPLLRYNRDLWDAAGLPSPKPDWSWTDFSGALSQLAEKRGDEIETYGLVSWNSTMAMLQGDLAANGIDLRDMNATIKVDDPKVIAALSRISELGQQGAFFTPSNEAGPGDFDTMRTLVAEGRAGMWDAQIGLDGGEQPSFGVGTALQPNNRQIYGEGWVISGGTQAPQAAWRWLSFLSRQEIKEPIAVDRGPTYIPARKSIAESSSYWKKLDEEATAVVQAVVEQPSADRSNIMVYNPAYGPIQTALEAVAKGTDPAIAARDAQAELDKQAGSVSAAPEAQPTVEPFVVKPPERAVAAAGATKISFTIPYDVGRYEAVAKQFNQQNPDVFVELRATQPTTSSVEIADLAQNSDCFLNWSPPEKQDYPLLLDLQPLADADASFARDDYPAAVLSLYRDGAALYGLPHEINLPVLAYNKVAFEQAGIAPPDAEWTIDDLIDAATKLTQGEGEAKQYGYASEGVDLLTFMEQNGVSLTSGSGDSIQPNFTDAKSAQAARAYIDLLKNTSPNKKISGYSRDSFGDDIYSLRAAGRVGMWYQFSINSGAFGLDEDKTKYQLAVAPLPNGASLNTASISGNSLHISAKTEHQQACWKWITFLGGQAGAVEYGIPARLSVAESAAFLDTAPAGAAEVVNSYKAMATTATPTKPWWQTDMDYFWFSQALDRALQGENLDRELEKAQRLTSDFLACVRTGEKGPTCAKQVDPKYNGWQNFEER